MERYRKIIPDWEEFINFSSRPLPKTIRVNTLKISPQQMEERMRHLNWGFRKLSFCPWGYEVTAGREISHTLEHWLGYYYIQEATSFIPVLALQPQGGEKILDLCSAPGGKATFIAQLTHNQALIWANDLGPRRIRALMANVYRLGAVSIIVTEYNGLYFPLKYKFDKVLVDAPCSGEGNMRKDARRLKGAEMGFIQKISGLQKGLLQKAIDVLKPGGIVIYSTCTLAPEENEMVIDYVLKKRDVQVEDIKLDIPHSPGITEWNGKKLHPALVRTMRIYPQHLNSGGGYVAKLRKSG